MQAIEINEFNSKSGQLKQQLLFARPTADSSRLARALKHEIQCRSWLILSRLGTRRMIAEQDFPAFRWRRRVGSFSEELLSQLSKTGVCFCAQDRAADEHLSIGSRLGLDRLLLESVSGYISYRRRSDQAELLSANNGELFEKSSQAQTLIFCVRPGDSFFADCQLTLLELAGILGCERILFQDRLLRLDSEEAQGFAGQQLSTLAESRLVISSASRKGMDYESFESQLAEILQRGFELVDIFARSSSHDQLILIGSSYQGISTPDIQQVFKKPDAAELLQALGDRDLGARYESQGIQIFLGEHSFEELRKLQLNDICSLMRLHASQGRAGRTGSEHFERIERYLNSLSLAHLEFSQPINTLSSSERLKLRILEFLLAGISECLVMIDFERSSMAPSELTRIVEILSSELHDVAGLFVLGLDLKAGNPQQAARRRAPSPQSRADRSVCFAPARPSNILPSFKEHGDLESGIVSICAGASSGKSLILERIFKEAQEFLPGISVFSNTCSPDLSTRSFAQASGVLDLLIDQLLRLEQPRKMGLQKTDFKKNLLCKYCQGVGSILLDCKTLSVPIECSHCNGTIFRQEIQRLKIGSQSLMDILQASACELFEMPGIGQASREVFQALIEIGLGDLALNMPVKYMSFAERVDLRSFQLIFSRAAQADNRRAPGVVLLLDDPLKGKKLPPEGALMKIFRQIAGGRDKVFCADSTGQISSVSRSEYSLSLSRQPEVVVSLCKL